jgi:hypothetical protein
LVRLRVPTSDHAVVPRTLVLWEPRVSYRDLVPTTQCPHKRSPAAARARWDGRNRRRRSVDNRGLRDRSGWRGKRRNRNAFQRHRNIGGRGSHRRHHTRRLRNRSCRRDRRNWRTFQPRRNICARGCHRRHCVKDRSGWRRNRCNRNTFQPRGHTRDRCRHRRHHTRGLRDRRCRDSRERCDERLRGFRSGEGRRRSGRPRRGQPFRSSHGSDRRHRLRRTANECGGGGLQRLLDVGR